jgi:hypothetical protein
MESNFFACGMLNLGISKFVQAWSKHPDLENIEYWGINGQVSMWPFYTLNFSIFSIYSYSIDHTDVEFVINYKYKQFVMKYKYKQT